MKKFYAFIGILWACAYLLPLHAQTTDSSCTAIFNYSKNGNTVSFKSVQTLPQGTAHGWSFGDGTGSAEPNPVHTYAAPGTYSVLHYIHNQATNCRDSVWRTITIDSNNCNIQAKFVFYRDSNDCRKVYFINQSTPISPNVHFVWKFGDGTTSNDINPTHIYQQDGVFNVCLVMESGNNCRKEVCMQVEVRCSTPCNFEANFTWKRDSIQPNKIYFNNLTPVTSAAAHYIWKFGDGTTSNERNPVHVYQQPGTYRVCLVVEISNTCRKEVCKDVVVEFNQCNFEANFNWKRDSIQPNKIYFNNLTPVPTAAAHYIWKFGDGTTSNERNPVHIYQQPGIYRVCLVVEISSTCRKEICKEVVVENNQCNVRAKFEWRRDAAQLNKIWFTNLSQPIANIWRTYWSYGDGTSSQDFNSLHVYQQPGKYYVCLKVQSLSGCYSTYCDSVVVGAPCDDARVKFEYRRDSVKPYVLHFFAVGNTPIVQQTWSIVKLTNVPVFPPAVPVILNTNNPTYSFKDSGWYMVCLYAVTANNCKKTYCEKIYIEHGENGRALISSGIPVYPNPATTTVKLELRVEAPTMVRLRVIDGSGVQKMDFTTGARAGSNYIIIPVEKLSSGLYLVEIRYGNQLKLAKFQKS